MEQRAGCMTISYDCYMYGSTQAAIKWSTTYVRISGRYWQRLSACTQKYDTKHYLYVRWCTSRQQLDDSHAGLSLIMISSHYGKACHLAHNNSMRRSYPAAREAIYIDEASHILHVHLPRSLLRVQVCLYTTPRYFPSHLF